MLILTLLLLVLMVIIGLGILGQASAEYRAAEAMAGSMQALNIAQAGFEDARIKLQKDSLFPPQSDPSQRTFCYSERYTDLDGLTLIGQYSVTIDSQHNQNPWFVTKVTSVGEVHQNGAVVARRSVYGEFRTSPYDGPHFGEMVNFRDEGGL